VYKVTKHIPFCYGHRLLNYEGKCKHLHGHNGRAEIEITSSKLDGRGMVVDFDDIKNTLKVWIDEALDHKMLLHKDDPIAKVLADLGEPCFLMEANPTAENIARLILEYGVSKGFAVTEVKLWETETSYAVFHRD
jgi:6-pyruvoyltetrahydropterin/6-carboxytetrahydropterin synthase